MTRGPRLERPRQRALACALAACVTVGMAGACNETDASDGEAASGSGSAPSDSSGSAESGGESGETGDTGTSPIGPFSEACDTAPLLGTGRVRGNLRDRSEQGGGACAPGGPRVYFSVEMPQRADLFVDLVGADFSPRLEWLNEDCIEELSLACAAAPTFAAYDLRAGARLRFAVSADPDAPALDVPWELGQPDPLDFEIDIDMRGVLDEGEPCVGTPASALSRCGGALICGDAGLCVTLPGNACANASSLAIPTAGAPLTFEVDADTPWTDAHAHTCGGLRLRERVFALDRAELLSLAGRELEISQTGGPRGLTLALRGAGCLVDAQRGCAPDALISPLRVPVDALLAGSPADAYLFVEFPEDAVGLFSMAIAVVDP